MKRMVKVVSAFLMCALLFTACYGGSPTSNNPATTQTEKAETATENKEKTATETKAPEATEQMKSSFDTNQLIHVVSREGGSGTRGAFIELLGVEVKGDDGTKKDKTTKEATIANKTDIMMQTVANDTYAIGYISLGSMNDTVKALQIDGVVPSSSSLKDGSYAVARPFIIATKGEPTGLAKDFIDFIMSQEGQTVVAKSYIAVVENAPTYAGEKPAGKLAIGGSSSVTPIMEKLAEAYKAINPNATLEIQMSDSTTGMTGVIDGSCDIGMASRALKDSEKEWLKDIAIAMDGITVVVHPTNPAVSLSKEQVRQIFTGEVELWSEVQ